jgi:hypothetical protein
MSEQIRGHFERPLQDDALRAFDAHLRYLEAKHSHQEVTHSLDGDTGIADKNRIEATARAVYTGLTTAMQDLLYQEIDIDMRHIDTLHGLLQAQGIFPEERECGVAPLWAMQQTRLAVIRGVAPLYMHLYPVERFSKWFPEALLAAVPEDSQHEGACHLDADSCDIQDCPVQAIVSDMYVSVFRPDYTQYSYAVDDKAAHANLRTMIASIHERGFIDGDEWQMFDTTCTESYARAFPIDR